MLRTALFSQCALAQNPALITSDERRLLSLADTEYDAGVMSDSQRDYSGWWEARR